MTVNANIAPVTMAAALNLAAAHRVRTAAEKVDITALGSCGRAEADEALGAARKALRVACGGPYYVCVPEDVPTGVGQVVTNALQGVGIIDANGAVAPWVWDHDPSHWDMGSSHTEAVRVLLT